MRDADLIIGFIQNLFGFKEMERVKRNIFFSYVLKTLKLQTVIKIISNRKEKLLIDVMRLDNH